MARIRKWIVVLVVALAADMLLIILVGRQVVLVYHPAPVRETTPIFYQPDATPLPGCVPLFSAPGGTQWPTPGTASPAEDIPVRPTITPLPVIHRVDLAPSSPEDQKSTVMVYLCSGKFQEYLLGPDQALSTIPLYEGDVILLIVPPTTPVGPGSQ